MPFATVFVLLCSGAAIAAISVPLRATLANAPKTATPFIGSVIWRCDGTNCVTLTQVVQSDVSACSALAEMLGPVTSFTSSNGEFGDSQLRTCNSGAGKMNSSSKTVEKSASGRK